MGTGGNRYPSLLRSQNHPPHHPQANSPTEAHSLLETEHLLELGKGVEGKDLRETQMILNHKAAIELLVEHAAEIGFNRYTICNLHVLLSENLLADPQAGGRLRSIPVGIAGTTFHPLEVPQLIEECFQQALDTADAILDPVEQAFFVMVHLPYLQPAETKLISLHEGNIARYRLRPSEYQAWRETWH